MQHAIYIVFLFTLGSVIGSFLNVVVWRLPRVEIPMQTGLLRGWLLQFKQLSYPPSHCPNCNQLLKWYDNLPIIGWLKLRGRCRFCRNPISSRYPIIEFITAILFAGYYVAFYICQTRTCCPQPRVISTYADSFGFLHEVTNPLWIWSDSWPIYFLYMALVSGLLAASLIDFELYIIPAEIPWLLALIGFVVHTLADRGEIPGSLNLVGDTGPPLAALSAGAAVGLAISIALWLGGIIPTAFAQGEPMLDHEMERYQQEKEQARRAGQPWDDEALPPVMTKRQIRAEIPKEMLFLLPPLFFGGAFLAAITWMPTLNKTWAHLVLSSIWLNGLLGSLLGALVGGFVVWIIRILGTLGFGKVAMGLGDVHLMFGVGAIIGGSGATIAFFIAPFFAILTALYRIISRKSWEIPLGPYLSMATGAVMLFYCPIMAYLQPGFTGLLMMISSALHQS